MKHLIKGDLICKKICMFVKFVEQNVWNQIS